MSSAATRTIGELESEGAIVAIQDGNHGEKHPKTNDYVDEGIPFVMANNLGKGYVDISSCAKLSKEQADKLRIGFSKTGDVLLTHKGTIGNVAVVGEVDPYIMLTPQVTYYRVNPKKLSKEYLSFAFRDPVFQANIKSQAQQSTRPYIGVTAQRRLTIRWHERPVQDSIVEIIRPYDDLIENNRRRIALLEEAARLLYREWFVHLRFPGHEHAKIVDGVPNGWTQSTIGEHSPLVYGKALKADTRVEGEIDVYGSSGIVGAHNKKLVSGPAVVVGRKGNVGSIFWARRDFWPIDTVYYITPENSDFFTYYALQNVTFINTDVAVPGLNRDFAHSRKLLLPTDALLEGFHAQVEPIQAQIGLLERQIVELAKARDLLLPRLMDGRLEV